jgi:ATP-dependent exoDNAse (exonuclease V) alpha subunit
MEFPLTKDQQLKVDIIESTNDNYLLHGKPGVGKSVLIRALIERNIKKFILSAPTGLAALNIGGRTIHSLFKVPASEGIIHPDYNNFTANTSTINNIKYNLQHLIVDEMSMVRVDIFDYVDRFLRYVKNKDLPFGGVQIILVGDFFQLPPVAKPEDIKALRLAGYDTPFTFSSKVFQESFKVLTLDEVLRQKGDPNFIKLLHGARNGEVAKKYLAAINRQVAVPEDIRIKLCATNKEAEIINRKALEALEGPSIIFQSTEFGEWPAYPAEKELHLRVGAQVMVKKNGADRPPDYKGGWDSDIVNGTLGKITAIINNPSGVRIDEDGEAIPIKAERYVVIETDKGTVHNIYWTSWERKVKVKRGDEWEELVVAGYQQVPVALAWAISIHKSQGQTFDKVHIDSNKIFAAGQLYVALSRCRTMSGITLERKIDADKFWADMRVLRFNELIEEAA